MISLKRPAYRGFSYDINYDISMTSMTLNDNNMTLL